MYQDTLPHHQTCGLTVSTHKGWDWGLKWTLTSGCPFSLSATSRWVSVGYELQCSPFGPSADDEVIKEALRMLNAL